MTTDTLGYEILPAHNISPVRYSFQHRVAEYLERYLSSDGEMVLDFGCGSGIWRFLFPGRKYLGFDNSDHDYQRITDEGCHFLIADGRLLPFKEGSFDFIFCNAVLEHIREDFKAIQEMHRVLKEGKYCCIVVPSKLTPIYDELPFLLDKVLRRGSGHGYHYYSRKEISALLKQAGFHVETITYSAGFFCGLLKIPYIYKRKFKRYIQWLTRQSTRINLYTDSAAWQATSLSDLLRIQSAEWGNLSLSKRVYRALLAIAFALDKKAPLSLTNEWLIVAKKTG